MKSWWWLLTLAAAAAKDCAPPSEGVCRENGYPDPGVNVDEDCCAATYTASCAAGYSYSSGGVCYRWDSGKAHSTCCTPCEGPDCDPGPGATCSLPQDKICMERGYPKIGDNVDEDCCAMEGKGWCAEGYEYTMGDLCYKSGHTKAYATCCQPCNSTDFCEDGPGNDHPAPRRRAVFIILIFMLCLCLSGIVGLVVACWCCCTPQRRRAAARQAMASAEGSYVPVQMGMVVGVNEPDDVGVELGDFGIESKNPLP